jgi:hypothetical protein
MIWLRTTILALAIFAAGTAISNAQELNIQEPQVVDLRNISRVNFELDMPGTITSFVNVIPGRLYVFYFGNNNTTITDANAFLANRNTKATFISGTSVLFVGESFSSVRQVADGVTSR